MASNPQLLESQLLGGSEGGPEFHLSQVLEMVKRRRRLLLLVLGGALALSIVQYAITPKAYRAVTVVQIERRTPGVTKMEDLLAADSWWDSQSFYPTQYRLLQSRGLAERVVKQMRLNEDPVFMDGDAAPAGAELDEATAAGLAGRVLGGIEVNPIRETRLVEISYVAPTAELAARVANGIADAYISWGLETRTTSVGRASSTLTTQIDTLKAEIRDREGKLQSFRQRSDIVTTDPRADVSVQRLDALNRDYSEAVSERIGKEARLQQLGASPKESIAESVSGDLVRQLRTDLVKLEREYASKLAIYKPEFPAMQDLKAQIDKGRVNLDSVIEETVNDARRSARADYDTALRREQSLANEITRLKGDVMRLNSASVEYDNLRVEVSTRRALLDDLVRRLSETEVVSSLGTTKESTVTVVDRALMPGGPYRPSLRRNLMIGLALGLLLGASAVFLLEYLDRTVKTAEDIERLTGLPVLAVIPELEEGTGGTYGYSYSYSYGRGSSRSRSERRAAAKTAAKAAAADAAAAPEQEALPALKIELLPHSKPQVAVSEAYRSLRTALLLSRASGVRCVAVTSTLPGEGKTTTAANLAVVLAQLGKEVLLVDGDMRKPRMHELFGVSNRIGLVSFLAGTMQEIPVIARTPVAGLYLVPSGPQPPNPAELLASDRMREFLAQAREHFEYVVIDSPPTLPVTDPAVLGAQVDGVVLCVAAGRINREDLKACHKRLQAADVHVLGAALNRFRVEARGYRYRSYHPAYASEDAPPAPAAGAPSGGA